ncbi:MAG: phosphoribosylglycinamide synthetase C domain-containing protein, partial [Candidatus Ranarchaeia archaeon]
KGPNTGSMGSYSRADHSLSFLRPDIIIRAKNIMKQAVQAIHKDTDRYYQGVLYGQFMQTSKGVYLIEFNVRFGDPEAMNVLHIMESSLVDTGLKIVDGNLSSTGYRHNATVCVYLVPQGYPENPSKDQALAIEDTANSTLYYASVYSKNGDIFTTGSRALAILAEGHDVADARNKAYKDVSRIRGNIRYRNDIAADIM